MAEPTPPTPLVFNCKVCGKGPIKLIGAKWRHPVLGDDRDHVAKPVQAE